MPATTDAVWGRVQGLDIAQSSPTAFAAFIRDESAKFARIARASNIRPE